MSIRDKIYDTFRARRRAVNSFHAALDVGVGLQEWAGRNPEMKGQPRMTSEMMDPSPPGRKGHFMRLASGTKYWPIDPSPAEIFIDDIAKSLSKLCRFNGHTMGERFYSVAEHSVLCSYYVPDEHALEALLHDAAEAFTGDLIRPIKVLPHVKAVFGPIEELNEIAIAERFELSFPFDPWVKRADEAVCTRELRTIMNGARGNKEDENQDVCVTIEEADFHIACLYPSQAENAFLSRFFELMAERNRARWLGASHNSIFDPTIYLSPAMRRIAA